MLSLHFTCLEHFLQAQVGFLFMIYVTYSSNQKPHLEFLKPKKWSELKVEKQDRKELVKFFVGSRMFDSMSMLYI